MILNLARIKGLALRVNTGGDHVRSLIHIREEKCRADAGLGVKPRAPISVSTGSNLEVEGAVNPILFRSEN